MLALAQLHDTLVALGAGYARFPIDGLYWDLLQVLQLVDEGRRFVEAGIDTNVAAGPSQGYIEQASLLGDRIGVGRWHCDLQGRIVLDLTGENRGCPRLY